MNATSIGQWGWRKILLILLIAFLFVSKDVAYAQLSQADEAQYLSELNVYT